MMKKLCVKLMKKVKVVDEVRVNGKRIFECVS